MNSEWMRLYSSAFQNIVNVCRNCGAEKVEATPYCPMCGAFMEDNEGQVSYTLEECGRDK